MNTKAIGRLVHNQTPKSAKSDSIKPTAPKPTKKAIAKTTKHASVRRSICDLLRCFSPKTRRSVTRTHQPKAFQIVYIAHCSRRLIYADENGTSVCLSATEAGKVKVSKLPSAQLQRNHTSSAPLPFDDGWRLHLRRRSALPRAAVALIARHGTKTADFAKVTNCASLPLVLTAASARAAAAY
ncbi:hypothetical protein PhaeoP23_01743 [Phaeobacter piscinae]|uniref:Uncharacterized protein n=1 Tax=Phaeobacter piscinae TaxID=1580596 RepID=A0ABN5DEY6_9RHOB|nr:hypothetical protein PhaeoP36_01743 [Phaeobacter piscinae]AUQ86406.1 hypothetical protein PhaeoP42_01744 [Phaeobacter piscinae]AUR24289.1 hypothetical protein PhaeoP23_01743 [Phaeobacter piscinae]